MDEHRLYTRQELFRAATLETAGWLSDLFDESARAAARAVGGGVRAASRRGLTRPPGALAEPEFLDACTRCDECVKACPHLAIRKAGPELGDIEGTPALAPRENPCRFCPGLPCVAACKPGALVAAPGRGIGLAVVDAERCYMNQGQPCDYCQVRCPRSPKAIRADVRGEPARVDAGACDGCGECAQICPAGAVSIEGGRW